MVDKIEKRTKKALRQGMLFSQIYDEIIKSISCEGFIYNKDCFIGVDFMNSNNHTNEYKFDEVLFDQSSELAVNYYNQLTDTYNPLFILNPFGENDDYGFNQLHKHINERTMLGCTSHVHDHPVSVIVSKIHKKIPFAQEHENVLNAHKKGLKYITICHDSFGPEYINSVLKEVKPDFIQTRQPLKHLEEQG